MDCRKGYSGALEEEGRFLSLPAIVLAVDVIPAAVLAVGLALATAVPGAVTIAVAYTALVTADTSFIAVEVASVCTDAAVVVAPSVWLVTSPETSVAAAAWIFP